jgi:hypothetical protein
MLDYLVIPLIKPVAKQLDGGNPRIAKAVSNSLEKKKPVKKIKEPPIVYR